jgi:hypothetical protein
LGYSIGRQVEWECVISKVLAGEREEEFGVEIKQETMSSPVFDSDVMLACIFALKPLHLE